ncbi:MAG TPA: lipoprotein-releasing ABC transporter permease subunit, partial [Ochrobactrum sp.]|nr:lipoprotein-releasing ABC transporter permease subunit [Ochrobactrum sp.]
MSNAAAAKPGDKAKVAQKAPKSGPFSAFERMIAWRYLRARRRETFISVIAGFSFTGIMLGVATLIIVMAVMNGFRAELLSRILGINGHLIMQPIDRPLDDYADLIKRIDGISGIRFAIPVVEGQALVQGNIGAGNGALIRGLREEDLEKLKLVSGNIRQGTLQGFDQAGGVAIGTRMAENLGLSIGDTLRVISPDGDVTPFGVNPRVKAYPIVAIFEIGMSEYDSSIVMMPLSEAQLFFNQEGKVQSLEIFVDNPDKVDAMRAPVEEAAGRQLSLVDWRQRNQTFFSALEVERNVMFMILTLIVLVAALNIISGLIMLVKDKGHDIAILRTMGATRGAVMRIFLMTGAAIGVTGT